MAAALGAGSISGSTLHSHQRRKLRHRCQPGRKLYLLLRRAASAKNCGRQSGVADQSTSRKPTSPITYSGTSMNVLPLSGNRRRFPAIHWCLLSTRAAPAPGTISGNTLTITSVGNFVIDANQAGNVDYSAAAQVQRSIAVNALTAQAINFTQPTTPVTYSSGLTIPLGATGGASGNAVVFTIDGGSTGAGSISGSMLTVSAAGSFVIDANQAGNSTYSAAPQVQRTVVDQIRRRRPSTSLSPLRRSPTAAHP